MLRSAASLQRLPSLASRQNRIYVAQQKHVSTSRTAYGQKIWTFPPFLPTTRKIWQWSYSKIVMMKRIGKLAWVSMVTCPQRKMEWKETHGTGQWGSVTKNMVCLFNNCFWKKGLLVGIEIHLNLDVIWLYCELTVKAKSSFIKQHLHMKSWYKNGNMNLNPKKLHLAVFLFHANSVI